MTEIESLSAAVKGFAQKVDFWNEAMIWGLAIAATATVFAVIATRRVVTYTSKQSAAQDQLSEAKDRQLQSDLKEKDRQIADANKATEDESTARVELQDSISWRRLTHRQQSEIAAALRRFRGHSIQPWFNVGDKEAETFAREIASSLHDAQWNVFSPGALVGMKGNRLPFNTPPGETGVLVTNPRDGSGRDVRDALVHELVVRGFNAIASDHRGDLPPGTDHEFTIMVNVRPEGPQGEAKLRAERAKITGTAGSTTRKTE